MEQRKQQLKLSHFTRHSPKERQFDLNSKLTKPSNRTEKSCRTFGTLTNSIRTNELSRAIAIQRSSPTRNPARTAYQTGFRNKHRAASNRCEKRQSFVARNTQKTDGARSKSKQKLTLTQFNKSLNYTRRNDPADQWLTPVLNVINRLFSSNGDENGCSCSQPCKWAIEMKEWCKKIEGPQPAPKGRNNVDYGLPKTTEQQIEKDIPRTHGNIIAFQTQRFKKMLREVLFGYAKIDPQLGYVQGMNSIAGAILFHAKETGLSLRILQNLMKYCHVRKLFLGDFEQCMIHIEKIDYLLKAFVNDLYKHFKRMNIDLKQILSPWILSLMTAIVPIQYVHYVIWGLVNKGWEYVYQTCLAYIIYLKDCLINTTDESEVFSNLSVSGSESHKQQWPHILRFAHQLKI